MFHQFAVLGKSIPGGGQLIGKTISLFLVRATIHRGASDVFKKKLSSRRRKFYCLQASFIFLANCQIYAIQEIFKISI